MDIPMHRRAAFTLVEMLMALALMALVSSVLISGMSGFFQQKESRPDDTFWSAVNSARQQALEHEETVSLQFNEETAELRWSWHDGQDVLPLPQTKLRFLPAEKSATRLIGGVQFETDALPRVRFYPDGTCDAFRAELTVGSQAPRLLRIDPWTCAPMLATKAP
jgi:prepilin-type N-terminal cleavage/methylation domain-containing protein